MRPLSKTEFAKERGVSRTRVYQWIDDGRIVALEDGSIDADDAHARLNANLDQAKGIRRDGNVTSSGPEIATAPPSSQLPLEPDSSRQAAPAADDDRDAQGEREAAPAPKPGSRDESGYWEHKARREKAEAHLSEMKALQAAGALTPALAVGREARETGRMLRNALLAIPDRIAPVLDPSSPSRAHKLLTDELQRVIRELTGRLDERAAGAATARESDTALV